MTIAPWCSGVHERLITRHSRVLSWSAASLRAHGGIRRCLLGAKHRRIPLTTHRHWCSIGRIVSLCNRVSTRWKSPPGLRTRFSDADVAQLARAPPCQGGGREFESRHPLAEQAPWWGGRVVRQRPAKPSTRVRLPSPPQMLPRTGW